MDHVEGMRRKKRGLALLFLALALVAYWLYSRQPGGWGIALGWAALIFGLVAGNRLLRCPACGERLASIMEKICGRCGAVLTDEPVTPPSMKGPADPRTLAYMAESRRILARWAMIRRGLGKSVYAVGVLAALAVMISLRLADHGWSEAVGLGLFLGLVCAALAWLILVHGVDNLFAVGFLLLRGRCPACRAWLNPPSTLGPGSFDLDCSLPDFCSSCGAKLS